MWQILGLDVFHVETDTCLFSKCLLNRLEFFSLLLPKNLNLLCLPLNKLSSRCSDVVPEGVGRLELWICRLCCSVFFSHPETKQHFCLLPWGSIMEVISISSCAALFLLLTDMLRSSFNLKYEFSRAPEVTWNHFPAGFLGHWELHSHDQKP